MNAPGDTYRRQAAFVALFAGSLLTADLVGGPVTQAHDCLTMTFGAVTAGAATAGAGILVGGPIGAVIGTGAGVVGSVLGGCTEIVEGTAHPVTYSSAGYFTSPEIGDCDDCRNFQLVV